MIKTFRLRARPEDDGRRLDEVVETWLAEALKTTLSRSASRKLVMAGAVRVNGRPLRRPAQLVRANQQLEARVDTARIEPARRDRPFAVTQAEILFEDRWLLAVAKPAALPFHPTADPRRPSLVEAVREYLGADAFGAGRGEPYVGVHQRLDRDTSGVALFAKRREANEGLAASFAGRAVSKIYHALTVRPRSLPPAEWTVSDRLGVVGAGRRARMGEVDEGGALAHTDFRVLSIFSGGLLVEARPRTGRKHQIRAHLAAQGLPILGDERYSSAVRAGAGSPRPMLHALRLELRHPVSGEPLVLECPYPEDFQTALDGLRQS